MTERVILGHSLVDAPIIVGEAELDARRWDLSRQITKIDDKRKGIRRRYRGKDRQQLLDNLLDEREKLESERQSVTARLKTLRRTTSIYGYPLDLLLEIYNKTSNPRVRSKVQAEVERRVRLSNELVVWCPRCGDGRITSRDVAYSSKATMYCPSCLKWMDENPTSVWTISGGRVSPR